MNIIQLVIFAHILSAIALFVTWALEYKLILGIQNSLNTEPGNKVSLEMKLITRSSMLSMITALATGMGLMVRFSGAMPWTVMAMVSLIIGLSFKKMARLRMRRLALVNGTGNNKIHKDSIRYLIPSIRLRIAIGVGIIALMVLKPMDLYTAVLIVLLFLIIGGWWFVVIAGSEEIMIFNYGMTTIL